MADIFPNNLYERSKTKDLTIAFGIRLCPNPAAIQIAKTNGYHAVFIELEHSVLTEAHANALCTTALHAGVTPFVRVPYQCGDGFVQRVLDGGAMGVVFPHISTEAAAKAAVAISKYPPLGHRSMTGQLPQFSLTPTPLPSVIAQSNAVGSTVIVMIESAQAIANIASIAAVRGLDVLLIGANDLSIELGVPGDFRSDEFRGALGKVSEAARKEGKIMGLAGIYDSEELQGWAVRELGVGFMLAQQDSSWIASGSKACLERIEGWLSKQ